MKFTTQLATKICERLMRGESLRQICAGPKMPSAVSIYRWLRKGSEMNAKPALAQYVQQYARARGPRPNAGRRGFVT